MDESRSDSGRLSAVADYFGLRGADDESARGFEWWMLTTPIIFGIAANETYGTTLAIVIVAVLTALPAAEQVVRFALRRPRSRPQEGIAYAGAMIALIALAARWIDGAVSLGHGLLVGVGIVAILALGERVVHLLRRGTASSRPGR